MLDLEGCYDETFNFSSDELVRQVIFRHCKGVGTVVQDRILPATSCSDKVGGIRGSKKRQ